MADRWQPGDAAKCVDVRDIRLPFRHAAKGGRYLRLGLIYPVNAVSADQCGEVLLDVGAQHGPKLARRFVKVPPLEESAEALAEAGVKVAA